MNLCDLQIKLWANVEFINGGYANEPLDMAVTLFNAFENEVFKNVPEGAPPKIGKCSVDW